MSAEHQLERSVLERKERDELQAIAQAMELDLPARARKADIIDQILEATGVIQSASYVSGSRESSRETDKASSSVRGGEGRPSGSDMSTTAEDPSPVASQGSETTMTETEDAVTTEAAKGRLFADSSGNGEDAERNIAGEDGDQEGTPGEPTKTGSVKKTRSSTRSRSGGSRRSAASKKGQESLGQLPDLDKGEDQQLSRPSEVTDGAVHEGSSVGDALPQTDTPQLAQLEDSHVEDHGKEDSRVEEEQHSSEEPLSRISLNGVPSTKETTMESSVREDSATDSAKQVVPSSSEVAAEANQPAIPSAVGQGVEASIPGSASAGVADASSANESEATDVEVSAMESTKTAVATEPIETTEVLVPGQPAGNGSGEIHVIDDKQVAQKSEATSAGDSGNRRSRRRRGRDRDRSDRDTQAQGTNAESQYQGELIPVKGLIDLRDEGYGFVRANGYLPSSKDTYVAVSQVKRFGLRKGDYIEGAARPAASNEKFPALIRIDSVSGLEPEQAKNRPRFEDLTPLFPDSRLRMEIEGDPDNLTARIVDLLCPIGKGQRGLIVSPPKAGKTTVMKQIAHSIEVNNPEVYLMVLLVDERPEEVTDMRRSVKGEVVASTFDRPADEHTAVAEMAMEHAKRLVEVGRDVVIILDGITRLARAYNLAQPATGRIMSGGVDSGALYPPKKFFGAARNIEEGGSLTILATALVETGSRMDEVIFEEFKGTGNMELRLDRKLAERRIYPAIDVNASSTRHEELLFDRSQLQQVWKLRRVLNALAADGNTAPGLELLMDKIKSTKGNDEFLAEIAKGPSPPV